MNHNFQISNCDTDSISFCKTDGTPFDLTERQSLVKEINDLSPEFMTWADDGYYSKVIILKAKNYILLREDGKIIYKGSALKDQKKPIALKEFLHEIIDTILTEKYDYVTIYNKYVKEILNMTDIKRWASKRTLTEKVLNGTRANETKVLDAIKDAEYSEGDKLWVYFTTDDSLKLVENYNNDHNVPKLLKSLHSTAKTFDNIIEKGTFKNYSLKNKVIQEELKNL